VHVPRHFKATNGVWSLGFLKKGYFDPLAIGATSSYGLWSVNISAESD